LKAVDAALVRRRASSLKLSAAKFNGLGLAHIQPVPKEALGQDGPKKVLPFYLDDAVLWGRVSPIVHSDRTGATRQFCYSL
jgi:hypothetical protein